MTKIEEFSNKCTDLLSLMDEASPAHRTHIVALLQTTATVEIAKQLMELNQTLRARSE